MPCTIALAQTTPVAGDIQSNISQHLALIDLAADHGATLVAFPEMSITGYELELANDLAFTPNDVRLTPLKQRAQERTITIAAGAPVHISDSLHIGAFVLPPDGSELIYTKRYLHHTESPYFEPGILDPKLSIGNETISLAICADLTNPQHASDAAASQSTVYLAMAFITPDGYARDADFLQGYAKEYGMNVLLSNFCTPSGGLPSAGRTAAWRPDGDLAAELDRDRPGLLLAIGTGTSWDYHTLLLK